MNEKDNIHGKDRETIICYASDYPSCMNFVAGKVIRFQGTLGDPDYIILTQWIY